jgi:hypothetical protein
MDSRARRNLLALSSSLVMRLLHSHFLHRSNQFVILSPFVIHPSMHPIHPSAYRSLLRRLARAAADGSIPRAHLLVTAALPVAFLTLLAAVNDLAAAVKELASAHLNAAMTAVLLVRDLAALGHANQCEGTLAVVEATVEAHDEPCNAIVRRIDINLPLVDTSSNIEAAATNEAPK